MKGKFIVIEGIDGCGKTTQIAKANADLVLMGDQLNGLPYALNLAKKTIRKIKQNLIWALVTTY